MSYDWDNAIELPRFSREWFDESDRRFVHAHRLFAHTDVPFGRILPLETLRGRRVLEIGCGMGLHTEAMVRAGAEVTAIDISETSCEATRTRLSLKALAAQVLLMDARKLQFPDQSFDFVWSWGVVHHSAQTALILREISRVLRQGGEVRLMVYRLGGTCSYATLVRYWLAGFWFGRSFDEVLWKHTDGFMARYYTEDMMHDVASLFFSEIALNSFGQDVDAVPLPRRLRAVVLRFLSRERTAALANRRGSFLFMTAKR